MMLNIYNLYWESCLVHYVREQQQYCRILLLWFHFSSDWHLRSFDLHASLQPSLIWPKLLCISHFVQHSPGREQQGDKNRFFFYDLIISSSGEWNSFCLGFVVLFCCLRRWLVAGLHQANMEPTLAPEWGAQLRLDLLDSRRTTSDQICSRILGSSVATALIITQSKHSPEVLYVLSSLEHVCRDSSASSAFPLLAIWI